MKKKRVYRKLSWDGWYALARDYYEEHGDLLVPSNYKTINGYRLGRWIERQRAMYNGVLGAPIYGEQRAALERIGMVWKLEERLKWDVWMGMVKAYYERYHNLAVPTDYVTKDGHRLGYWIKEQRKKRKAGRMPEGRIQDLDQYNMIWSCYEKNSWFDWYELAQKYHQEHGDLLVPSEYTAADGERLGLWIAVQRERYSGKRKRKPLTLEQIEALERMDMVWTVSGLREEKWNRMYHWVEEYALQNGKLPLWPEIKAPDGRSMNGWISTQRTNLGRGKMSADREKKLTKLGIHAFGKKPAP